MPTTSRCWPCLLALVAVASDPARGHAQVDPERGDVNPWQTPGDAPPVAAGDPAAAADGAADDAAAVDPATLTDHHAVVGRFGVGFFGVREVVVGAPDADGDFATVPAPSIGVRHWLDDRLALEGALGLGFRNLSVEAEDGTDERATYAFVVHLALPVALYHHRHYAFLVVPETDLGLAGGSRSAEGGDDTSFGVTWRLGVRLGAELHFGFIGVPDLSLQASVGVRVRVQHGRDERCEPPTCDLTTEERATEVDFGTTVEGDPWDIFTGAITAIYYF